MHKLFPILFLLTTVFLATLYAQTEKTAIAVLTFGGRGISESEAITLTDRVRSELVKSDVYNVMERQEMENVLKEQEFQMSGACSEASCIVEVGQLIAVKKMVGGSISKVGDMYSIEARLIDVKTGKIEKNVIEDFSGHIELLLTKIMAKVARRLAGLEEETKSIFGGNSDLFLKSTPSGGIIYIDDQPTNQTTPATIRGLESGIHSVRVDNGDTEKDTTVSLEAKAIKSIALLLEVKARRLRIYTDPPEAEVYISDTLVGETPFETIIEYDGQVEYVLKKLGYSQENGTIKIEGPKRYTVEKSLTILTNVGRVQIDGNPKGALVVLDNTLKLGTIPLNPKEVYFGKHFLNFSAPGYFDKKMDIDVNSTSLYKYRVNLDAKSRNAALLKSAALPGWGQKYSGHKTRSLAYLCATAVSVAATVYGIWDHQKNMDNYDASLAAYQSATNTADAQIFHDQVNADYDYAQSSRQILAGAITATVICWAWNIADAYLFFPKQSAQRK